MAPASFSPFELLLLKSRYQPDTASLLLLAWVFVNKRVALVEDRRYLEVLANGYRHSRDLDTLVSIAASADLGAIQLAAEVILRERADEQSHPFLRRAIGLATSDGDPSLRNHHILRFLADLSGVAPGDFARLFREVAGRPLTAPGDPSRHAYWQNHEQTASHDTAGEAAPAARKKPIWQHWRTRLLSARSQRRQYRREREQLRQQARQRREEMLRQARQREEARRREQARREETQRQEEARRQEQARREDSQRQEEARRQKQEQHRQQWRSGTDGIGTTQPHYRVRLALQVLELDVNASPVDIKRAYRRLAQRHHPDRFHGQGDLRVALASQRFQRIKNAYDYLMTTV